MPYREVMGVLTDIGSKAPEMFRLMSSRFVSLYALGSFQ